MFKGAPGGKLGAAMGESSHASKGAERLGGNDSRRQVRGRVPRHDGSASGEERTQNADPIAAHQLLCVQVGGDAGQPAELHRRLQKIRRQSGSEKMHLWISVWQR